MPSGISLFLPFSLLLSVTHCQPPSVPQLSGIVTGTFDWKPKLYLIQPRGFADLAASFSGAVIDSAWIESDGSFSFTHLPEMTGPQLAELCIQPAGARFQHQFFDDNPLKANYMPLVLLPGTSLRVTADAERFQATFSIENPDAENRAILHLRDLRQEAFARFLDSEKTPDPPDESQLMEREAALHRFQKPLMAFADSTAFLRPALVAIRWVSPEGDYERQPEFVVRQCRKWQEKADGNPWVAQLCRAADRSELPVLIGDLLPDYAWPLANGDTVAVRSMLGERLTLVDIWASWCAPCRRENRATLAPLWLKYREQGFQVLGYSIDSDPVSWKVAIKKDGALWPQASHLEGDAAPFLGALRISTIPANFLLDAQGRVVAKNLHGADLEAFMQRYFR